MEQEEWKICVKGKKRVEASEERTEHLLGAHSRGHDYGTKLHSKWLSLGWETTKRTKATSKQNDVIMSICVYSWHVFFPQRVCILPLLLVLNHTSLLLLFFGIYLRMHSLCVFVEIFFFAYLHFVGHAARVRQTGQKWKGNIRKLSE